MTEKIVMMLKTLFGIVLDLILVILKELKKMELSDVIVLKSICEQFIIKESIENKENNNTNKY